MSWARIVAVGSFILAIVHAYHIASLADGPIPMQFDIHGNVNWSISPHLFPIWHWVFLGFCNALTLGFSFLVGRISMKWVNIPWKNYWLSSEELKMICREKTKELLAWVAVFINLIAFLSQAMIADQMSITESWFPFSVGLGAFLAVTLGGTAIFVLLVLITFRPKRFRN